jgi:hypothetical protein
MSSRRWCLTAFGLEVEADFPLPGADPDEARRASPSLRVRKVGNGEIPEACNEPRILRSLLTFDGIPYAMLEGAQGDFLFLFGQEAAFQLTADRAELRCSCRAGNEATWTRLLLDTVLWTVSLLNGFELLHASAIQTPAGVIALVGSTGGGKSSLAAEFLRRGGELFADDVVALSGSDSSTVVAHPGPRLMNLPLAINPSDIPPLVPLHQFGNETWVRVPGKQLAAQPLAGVVFVVRLPGEQLGCQAEVATALSLLPHMAFLARLYSGSDLQAQRDRRRFALAADLVTQTPVLRLTADLASTPAELVDVIEMCLP